MTTIKTPVKRPVRITRAKLLDAEGFNRVLAEACKGEHALRNEVLLRLSFYCGLRAQEIAGLQWERHILTTSGKIDTVLRVTSDIAKGAQARVVERDIPLDGDLRGALKRLYEARLSLHKRRVIEKPRFVIYSLAAPRNFANGFQNRAEDDGVAPNTLVKFFKRLYESAGIQGATSHSGRRTFITNLGRRVNDFDASIRDVQLLAGHRDLNTTAGYIEPTKRARELVSAVF